MAAKEGAPAAGEIAASSAPAPPLPNGHSKEPNGYPVASTTAGYAADDGTRKVLVRRAKLTQKPEGLAATLCAWVVEHQIGLSINLLLLLFLTHISFPRARRRTRKFFELSYYDASTDRYMRGWDDLAFVAFWVVAFTGLRVAVMDYVLTPFASWHGVEKNKLVRFTEQAWLLLYCSVFWSLGMYIMYNSDYWLNLRELWTHFPARSADGLFKWYYLVQLAFWLQQILVVNIEERRKDYSQMFTHHIITIALIFMSYAYYLTKVGNVILCVMDIVDIILPAAKLLKYLNYQTACDVMFGVFVVTWFVTRHVLYMIICWSVHVDLRRGIDYGCYSSKNGTLLYDTHDPAAGGNLIWKHILQSFQRPDGVVCFNERIRLSFFGLLLALQAITLVWFAMIVKVTYKVLSGKGADDSRSDDDDSQNSEYDEVEVAAGQWNGSLEARAMNGFAPKEEEVGVEELRFVRRTSPGSRHYRRSGGRASGISIPGHSDRKELLGRIGCDKQPD